MRKVVLLGVLVLWMSGCTAFPEKKNPDWKMATRTERLNQLFWDDVAAKRWQNLKEHLAPLAVLTEGDKRTTGMEAILERLKSEGVTAAQLGEEESQPAGADLVTTYTLNLAGRPPARVMAIWQPAAKHWVLVAMSITVPSQ